MLQPVTITVLLSLLTPSLFPLGAVLMPLCSSFKSACTDSEPVSEGRRQPAHGRRRWQILMSQKSIWAIYPSRLSFEDQDKNTRIVTPSKTHSFCIFKTAVLPLGLRSQRVSGCCKQAAVGSAATNVLQGGDGEIPSAFFNSGFLFPHAAIFCKLYWPWFHV